MDSVNQLQDTAVLHRLDPAPQAVEVVKLMQGTVALMGMLIDNLLEFARAHRGNINVNSTAA